MLKRYSVIVFFILVGIVQAYGQNGTITGRVIDSSGSVRLPNASIALLQSRDSFLIADTRTDKNGSFSFSNLNDTASYILLFSFPKYVDYAHVLSMKDAVDGVLKMNKVVLIKKEKLLREVVVNAQISAIRIKGDTTEYKADSFKLQANANVEDLLRQLPGLQVDQYGNITAQGQKVKKVLVDGEEFFSDDPTLVTRNIRADMIDKVQVYDRKSDAATFTGIDDGVRDKTINLKIKEDRKNGIFGKVDAGAGNDKRYNAQAMINFFKQNRKMAAFGTASNTGRVGLGSADKQKIGDGDDKSENYDGVGLPSVVSGGLHYEQKWDKDNINGNYKFSVSDVTGSENTVSQNNLATGTILGNRDLYFDNRTSSKKLNTTYIHKFDTTSTVKIYVDAEIANVKNSDTSYTQNKRGYNNSMINDNLLYRRNDYNYNAYNLNISWEKKLKKYGRTLSFYLRNNFLNDDADGESRSDIRFYNTENNLDSTTALHLQKKMKDQSRNSSLKVIYTEMLVPKLSLILNYEIGNEVAKEDKRSFNFLGNPGRNTLDTAFTSLINTTIWNNQGGMSLNYNSRKSILKIGGNVALADMNMENILNQFVFRKQFVNWNPQATFNYKFTTYRTLDVNYSGNTVNPERTQLIPYAYNNSQLVAYVPNLFLSNSFLNSITVNYKSAKVTSQVYSGVYVNYNVISNPIVLSLLVDPKSGVYTYQYANMSGYRNDSYTARLFVSKKMQKLDIQASAYGGVNGGKTYSLVNNSINKLNYNAFLVGVDLYKAKVKKYDVRISGNGGYSLNKYSLQPDSKNNYFFYIINPSADYFFLRRFQLHTDANYTWQQRTQSFNDNFSRLIWNAWLGCSFLTNDQLTVKVSCNDILNQNNGYMRTATNTFFSENRYTTIRRFFMIGATWSFTKFSSQKQ